MLSFIILCLCSLPCAHFCHEFLKEMQIRNLITKKIQILSIILLLIYYFFSFIFILHSFFYLFLIPIPFVILLFAAQQIENFYEQNLLKLIVELISPIYSRMKLRMSFANAWQKSTEEIENKKARSQIEDVSKIFQFNYIPYHYPPRLKIFFQNLLEIRNSSQPLRQLKNFLQKIKLEQEFHNRVSQVLLQVKLQSLILSILYFGLFIFTFFNYGNQYTMLKIISFALFMSGFYWSNRIGRRMSWSV